MAIAISGGIAQQGWLYAARAAWIRLVLLIMLIIPHLLLPGSKALSVRALARATDPARAFRRLTFERRPRSGKDVGGADGT